jgi:hypothetical protein
MVYWGGDHGKKDRGKARACARCYPQIGAQDNGEAISQPRACV